MPCCVVRGCVFRWKNRDPSIILHTFPKEPEKIRHWLQQTGQYGVDVDLDKMVEKVYIGKINDTYRICSLHFTNDCYNHDGYRRILKRNSVPTIFDTVNPYTVRSVSSAIAHSPSVLGPSSSSSQQHIPSADSQKPSSSSTICTYRIEFQDVQPKSSSQPTIRQVTLVPVVPHRVFFQPSKISPKSNLVVGDRSVTIQPTAATTHEATQMHSALPSVSQQSYVSIPSTSSTLKVPVSSSLCDGQSTSTISLEQRPPANVQQSTSAPVIFLQKHSSPVLMNTDLSSDTKFRTEDTSSSTKAPPSNTSSSPILSSTTSSSSTISSSGFDKSPYKTTTPMSIPLTIISETKPCSMTVPPVSGKVSPGAQMPSTSGLAQKPPSISVVQIPLKTPTSQTTIQDCLPPTKKRKLEENTVLLKPSTAESSGPSVLPSHGMSQTSGNTGKLYLVSSSAPLVQPSCPVKKPLMVDKAVNTDFFTNKRSCCISTEHLYRRRNVHTQTKIPTKHRKIMCSLLVSSRPTNFSRSTISPDSPEDMEELRSLNSKSCDYRNDPCKDLETLNLDLVKVEIFSDSAVNASVPTSSDKKQANRIKEESESSVGQTVPSPTSSKSTFTIPNFDISTVKIEPNIKTEEDPFPISGSEQNIAHFVSLTPKIERLSPIPSEPLAPICRNLTLWETSAIKTEDEPEDPNDSSFHIDELSEDEDESFLVPSDPEDEDDVKRVFEDLDAPVENVVDEEKYIVFESCLKKLIMMIPCMSETKCMSPLTHYRKETIGSYLSIEVRCRSGHTHLLWESQPRHGYQPLGNVLLSAAVLFSGSSFLKSQHMFKLLNLKSIDKTSYYKNQSMYLFPAISHHWKKEQKAVLQSVQKRPLCLAGDQQLDNPGFSANYSIYSLMDVSSKKICSFSVEPVTPQVTMEGLERKGFQKAMGELQTMKADVKMIVTDRSVAVQEVLKDNYPGIVHKLDLWHLSKSIGNEVLMAAKHKDCEILHQWVEAIRNHIWWSSCTCCKNPDLLIQKWKSVIQHVANVHEWDGDSDCRACHHPPLPEEVVNNTNWLAKESAAYKQLKNIVENASLLDDLKQLSFLCHVGELEIYHRTCLKYRPKMLHFFMDSMVARTQLAALDHNRNVHGVKTVVENSSGGDAFDTMPQRLEASKGQKSWIIKALYKPTCQNFLFDIINDVVAFVKEEKTFL